MTFVQSQQTQFITKQDDHPGFIDARELRNALGNYPTGVAVVTAIGQQGKPVGMTINSFFSISLDPPLLGWCIDNNAGSFQDFINARGFTVSVLSHKQEALARRFASCGTDKFGGIAFAGKNCDGVAMPDCAASFRCHLHSHTPLGDHTLLVGQVIQMTHRRKPPLVFAEGVFQQLDNKLKTAA